MTDIIDTLDLEDGLVAEVRHDPDCPSPVADDEGVEVVILHNRYADPSEGRLGRTGRDVERWREENRDEWFSINLWAYDHSGVVYRAAEENPFTVDREWDTAQAGIVALKRSEWGDGNLSDEELSERAAQIAEAYSYWAAGNCFSFVLRNADGTEIASGDGIIGWDTLRQEAASAARRHVEATASAASPI